MSLISYLQKKRRRKFTSDLSFYEQDHELFDGLFGMEPENSATELSSEKYRIPDLRERKAVYPVSVEKTINTENNTRMETCIIPSIMPSHSLDKVSCLLFPVTYIVFILVYAIYYVII